MGSWQLEVGRMTLYIMFPISVYYFFNQTDYVEKWVKEEKKKLDTSESKEHIELLRFIEDFNNKQKLKQLAEMEVEYRNA